MSLVTPNASQVLSPYRVLLVDDQEDFLELFVQAAQIVGRDGEFELITATSGAQALDLVVTAAPEVVVTDLRMPGMDGLTLFHHLSTRYPTLPVILMTAYGGVEQAVEAIKHGAYHYFLKPIHDLDLFWRTVGLAAAGKRAEADLETARREPEGGGLPHRLVGRSPAWRAVLEAIHRVAPLPSTVLINGETGTGKEMVARAIHNLSSRASRPFVAVSCAELAGSLLETELFGHERGAFTGAVGRRIGLFERAHGGTLFLDEISETPPDLQSKLLRVLDGSPFFRVGGQAPILSNFRLLAATNKPLDRAVAAGRFRDDLFFRLAVHIISLPPLRERLDDILPLTDHFLAKTAARLRRRPKRLSGLALPLLMQRSWPGNVRELENVIERAVITSTGLEILPQDLFADTPKYEGLNGGYNLERMERLLISMALDRTGHNRSQAARLLGIARGTLHEKIGKYGLNGGETPSSQ